MNNSGRDKEQKYSEKLKDPRWQKIRLKIFERDQWSCQICKDTGSTLKVHHKYYLQNKEPWEYPPEALITLCENCHTEEWENRPEAEYALLRTLKTKGFFAIDLQNFLKSFQKMPMIESSAIISLVYGWALETPEIQQWLVEKWRAAQESIAKLNNPS